VYIYPYKMGSRSASALSEALGIRQIKHENSKFVGGERKTVINWGASELPPQVLRSNVINRADAVKRAGNKLHAFQNLALNHVSIPTFTSSREEAINWLERNLTVVARKTLTGHSGIGIEILEKGLDFVEAPCYTVYVPKDREYRVHVFKGQVIDVQRKVKDPNREVLDWKVRSHGNGFIFIRTDEATQKPYKEVLEPPVRVVSLQAVQALGLDFGAVDVVWNKRRGKAFVLEVNCAPGLEGTSVEVYANAFKTLP